MGMKLNPLSGEFDFVDTSFWNRNGTVLTPHNTGDSLELGEPILAQGSAGSKDALIEGRKTAVDDTSVRNVNYQYVWDNTADGYGGNGIEINIQTKAGNPYNMTGGLGAIMARAEHLGDGVATEMTGYGGVATAKDGGNLITGIGMGGAIVANNAIVENGVGVQGSGIMIGTGNIDKYRAIVAKNVAQYGSGTLTYNVGLNAEEMTGGVNNVACLLGTGTPPTGDWGIYNVSDYRNYIKGKLGIGNDDPNALLTVKDNLVLGGGVNQDAIDSAHFTSGRTETVGGDIMASVEQLVIDLGAPNGTWAYAKQIWASIKAGCIHNITKLVGQLAGVIHSGSGILTYGYGKQISVGVDEGGTITNAVGSENTVWASKDSTVITKARVTVSSLLTYTGTPTIEEAHLFHANCANYGGTIERVSGYTVPELSTGTDHSTNLLLGTDTIPDGDWNIYSVSPHKSKLSGELGMTDNKITDVTDPTANQDASTKKYVDDQCEKGEFSISNEVVAMGTTFTKTIPLSHANYTMGRIMLYVPNSVHLTANKRMASFIMFTTELNNAIAESGGRENYNVYGYNFTNSWMKGFYYNNDSKLSDVYFFDNGSQAGLRGQLRIESCQIVNDTIELKFRNTHATRNTNLTIDGRYETHM